MPTDATNVCQAEFEFTVEHTPECELEVQDTISPINPGGTTTVHFIYRNGEGAHAAAGWNNYLYNRNDTNADGSSRTAGTKASPSTGLVTSHNDLPAAPKRYKPGPTDLALDDVYVESAGDANSAWWTGSTQFTVPDAEATTPNADRIHTNVTFYGAIEMIP